MKKILIADDDEIICRGLSVCIEWDKHEIEVVGAVYDGEVALEYVEKYRPDIVIIDINMPFLDGMEFSYIVKERYPEIKIILLTAIKEFEYARQAVKLQVFSYITKPFSNDEVLETVMKAAQEINKEKQQRNEVAENLSAIREAYLEELIVNGAVDNEKLEMCNIYSRDSHFQAAILYFENANKNHRQFQEFAIDSVVKTKGYKDKIRAYLKKYEDIKSFALIDSVVILREYQSIEDQGELENELQQIIYSLNNEIDILMYCGVGRIYHGVFEIHFSYEEAIKALEESYNFGNKSVVLYEEFQRNSTEYQLKFQVYKGKICEAIQAGNYESVKEELQNMFEKVRESRITDIHFLRVIMLELVLFSYKAAADDQAYAQLIEEMGMLVKKLMQANNLPGIEKIVTGCFKKLCDYLESRKSNEYEEAVKLALDCMRKNYNKSEFMLKDVAAEVHVSANYLSSLFKKFQGNSYINCLNHIRIDQAKKLLVNRSVKMYEVAFKTGFNSSQYFSSCFKKSTGLTPGEYRQKFLK